MVLSLKNNDVIMDALLRHVYRGAVKNRCKKASMVKIPANITKDVAHKLDHPKLAKLFVTAQFWSLPIPFCRTYFNRPYPPPSVVFSGQCWERYKKYMERGINDGS